MIGMGKISLLGRLAMLAAAMSVAACADHSIVHRGRVARPARTAPPAPRIMPNSESFRMCAARLDAAQIRYQALPNEDKGGGE